MATKARLETHIERMRLKDLRILEPGENARFMTHEQHVRLVENLRQDGCLTSVPLVCRTEEGDLEVLSGNHRVAAALDAGIEEAEVLVIDNVIPKDRRRAIQLSHNAIVGQDDPAILAKLYQDLQDLDLKAYSGLGDDVLGLMPDVDIAGISEMTFETHTLQFLFMPHEVEHVEEVLEKAMSLAGPADTRIVADRADYDRLLKAMEEIESRSGVRNRATALKLILSVFEAHLDDVPRAK